MRRTTGREWRMALRWALAGAVLALVLSLASWTIIRPSHGMDWKLSFTPGSSLAEKRESLPPLNPKPGAVWVNPCDGMELVYVPPGDFLMGLSDTQIEKLLRYDPTADREWLFRDAQPQCRLRVPGFWIGRTEVTNTQYLAFVRATGHSPPKHWERGKIPSGTERFPVVFVDRSDAEAYCKWAGLRLPTEVEWERAARGSDGRLFPWGDDWSVGSCRSFQTVTGSEVVVDWETWLSEYERWSEAHSGIREGVADVGSYPRDRSPFGCLDMAGNVFEWCSGWYDAGAYQRYVRGDDSSVHLGRHAILRGGAWYRSSPTLFCSGYRGFHPPPHYRLDNAGFRCAKDPIR